MHDRAVWILRFSPRSKPRIPFPRIRPPGGRSPRSVGPRPPGPAGGLAPGGGHFGTPNPGRFQMPIDKTTRDRRPTMIRLRSTGCFGIMRPTSASATGDRGDDPRRSPGDRRLARGNWPSFGRRPSGFRRFRRNVTPCGVGGAGWDRRGTRPGCRANGPPAMRERAGGRSRRRPS